MKAVEFCSPIATPAHDGEVESVDRRDQMGLHRDCMAIPLNIELGSLAAND
jgi:hypothetical protein